VPYENWIDHRRPGDREVLGWIRPAGDDFVAVDRLGRDLTGPVDWLAAEEALDERGLSWLTDLWQLTRADGRTVRVRIVEASPERVVVKTDDFGAIDVPLETYVLPFPAPDELRPFAGDAHAFPAVPD